MPISEIFSCKNSRIHQLALALCIIQCLNALAILTTISYCATHKGKWLGMSVPVIISSMQPQPPLHTVKIMEEFPPN